MTDNILQMPTPKHILIDRMRSAIARTKQGRAEWIAGMVDQAYTLREARDQFGDNDTAFGVWLVENEIDEWNKDDRAGLINLARVAKDRGDLEWLFARYAEERLRPNTIWSAFKDKRWQFTIEEFNRRFETVSSLSNASIGQSASEPKTKNAPNPPQEPPKADAPEPQAAELARIEDGTSERHPFHGLPRAAEMNAIYQHSSSRWLLGTALKVKNSRKALWDLVLAAVDAGFLTPHKSHPNTANIRLLFPATSPQIATDYLLTSPKVVADIRDRIMPILSANREAFLAAPDQFHLIVKRHEESSRRQAAAEARDKKLVSARQTLPYYESEVTLYGKVFWPIVDISDPDQRYDYQQLQAAAWFFDDALKLARNGTDNSPKSCGMKIRFMVKRLAQFNDTLPADMRKRWRQVLGLVVELTRALEQAPPDAEIGNRLPLLPLDRTEA